MDGFLHAPGTDTARADIAPYPAPIFYYADAANIRTPDFPGFLVRMADIVAELYGFIAYFTFCHV